MVHIGGACGGTHAMVCVGVHMQWHTWGCMCKGTCGGAHARVHMGVHAQGHMCGCMHKGVCGDRFYGGVSLQLIRLCGGAQRCHFNQLGWSMPIISLAVVGTLNQ